MKNSVPSLFLLMLAVSASGESLENLEPEFILQPPQSPVEWTLSTPNSLRPQRSPFIAGCLSLVEPGLGRVYLHNADHFKPYSKCNGINFFSPRGEKINEDFRNRNFSIRFASRMYSTYATYRDERIRLGHQGYLYKMPTDRLEELLYASFNKKVTNKFEVWGGLLGALGAAACIGYYFYPEMNVAHLGLSTEAIFPLTAFSIGIREEALFRGFLQSALSEVTTPWGGILLSSLAFGAAHIPNALMLEKQHRKTYYTVSLPYITTLGMYMGWLTYKNNSLQHSVALHSWYDFTLFLGAYLAQYATSGKSNVSCSFAF